jgi:endonuclease I
MRKILLTALGSFCFAMASIAQTSLPTSWNFASTTLPTGWSEVNVNSAAPPYYSASGNPAPAYKLDATGDKLIIFFASSPGNLTYDITGNSFSGGTFLVEESVNGTNWTTLRTFTAPAGQYTSFTDVPNTASRYIRFNYSNKVAGNVGIDNVSLALGSSTTQQISVKQGSATIVNGATYSLSSPVSATLPTTFTVQNLGTVNTLNISGVTITGPAAGDYSVGSFPSTVSAASSGNLVVNFTPSAAGTRYATINIANDDPTANPYVINMYGVGGTFASEPTAQPTSFTFTNIKSYHFNASFTPASPAPDGGYIVLRRTGSAVTDVPVDGMVYQRGDVIGNSKVVYSSMATAFFPNEIVANTTYHFAVFAYNGPGTFRNYLTVSPLLGSQLSAGSMQPATYYNSASTSNAAFITNLHNKINPHTMQFYSNYGSLMVSKFYARDTTNNQRVVTCVYSGMNQVYSEPFDFTTNDFSREHTYCNSWQPTTNATPDNSGLPEYNDYHMLTPTNQNNVNAVRSNYPLGEVAGTPISTFLGSKLGYDSNGHKVFEPRDSDKGDAARCMMYESVCYTGVPYSGPPNTNVTYGGSWSFPNRISNSIPYGQDQNVLKKWHYQDPPDNFEIARNDYVDSLQGNRNPFIDSVQYACYIDFMTMTKINSPMLPCSNSVIGINEVSNSSDMMILAPNPNNGSFTLTFVTEKAQSLTINLFDMVGRVIYSNTTKVTSGYNPLEMNIPTLSKGIYTFVLITESGRTTEKLVID